MSRNVAFLRSINVGGHRVRGTELESIFSGLGIDNPSSFLASGNVVFDTTEPATVELVAEIERALSSALGYDVPTFLRTAEEVRTIASHEPFSPHELAASVGKPQVALLSTAPPSATSSTVLGMASDVDRLSIVGREVFWLPSGGTQESDLNLKEVERLLGPMTMRTINTIQRIVTKYLADGTASARPG